MADDIVKIQEVVGKGYAEFWHDRHLYQVLKGGRSSKKSTTVSIRYIKNLMAYPLANLLVVRQTANTHQQSTFAELQKATVRLKVAHKWRFTVDPCEARYLPTGQLILFRGFDDPVKLTSINVAKGVLCWVWFEEAFEIVDESAFDTLCEGIRGLDIEQAGLWKQFTISYNPWVNSHWTKTRFWGNDRKDTFRLTTTHKDNEFLTQEDHDAIEALNDPKSTSYNPDRYKVVGLGEYGIPGGAYFDEFRRDIHVTRPFPIQRDWRRFVMVDYGRDMLACYWVALDWHNKGYVYREIHKPGLFVSDAIKLIKESNVDEDGNQENIYQWFAPEDLDNKNSQTGESILDIMRRSGLPFIKVSNRKVDGCVNMHEWLKPYQDEQEAWTAPLVFFTTCANVINSIASIQCDEKDPNVFADKPHELTHSVTAIMYFTAGRPRSGKQVQARKYAMNSLEERIEKNLERLTKKRRVTNW